MKKNNKKGFTLAELLIVVAIIAVLVAIAIPVFSTQLEKSRDATSVSNMRAGYAEVMTAVIAGTAGTNVTAADGGVYSVDVVIKSTKADNWSGVAGELAFAAPTDPGKAGTYTMALTVGDDGTVSAATLTAKSGS